MIESLRPLLSLTSYVMDTLSLYIHVPFCGSKCAYCAFASHVPACAHRTREVEGWLAALEAEADLRIGDRFPNFSTVFIGGGTPTFLTEAELEALMGILKRTIFGEAEREITVEANPDSLTRAKADILRRYGVNRVSLGVQSLDDSLLRILGRRHTRADVRRAVNILRTQGFTNINFDLMFGLPGQDMDIWRRTVTEAAGLRTEHLSLYGLSVEPGTPLAHRLEWSEPGAQDTGASAAEPAAEPAAKRQLPDDDLQADMYEWAVDFLKEQGYERYETSNFAKKGFACQHNIRTWRGEDYIGLGPGAVSTVRGVRMTNMCELDAYIEGVGIAEAGIAEVGTAECAESASFYTVERLTQEQRMSEYMILGLRTAWGVEREAFRHRFGVELEDVFGRVLRKYTDARILGAESGRIFLKPRYFFVANGVMEEFIL
ncbi:MAG: radical SAM family heme chaperone HemW [Peptococcaceae bacterium]|nr:radical SAM family heme chaperone HemW [Peptococcaceae bacterium]